MRTLPARAPSRGWLCAIALAALTAIAPAARAEPADSPPAAAPVAPAETVPASAPEPAEPPPVAPAPPRKLRTFPKLRGPTLTHDLQFGIAVLSGSGYRGIFPYKENVYCGKLDSGTISRFCSSRIPTFIDVQASFGFTTHWDLLVDLRFGVEEDFTTTHQFAVAPGFRYWVDPELGVKFFTTVQVAYDTTAQHNPLLKNNDIAARNSNGLMIEVMRNLGFYAQFGETIGFVRWLRFEVDLGLGVQARFP